jgi:hypothetical protein
VTDARKVLAPRFEVDLSDLDAPRWVPYLAEGCRALIARVRFDATTLPVDDLFFVARPYGVKLVVDLHVPDREQESPLFIHIWRTLICPWDPIKSNGPEYLVRWMNETVANVLAHETAESITIDGVRVFDPHKALVAEWRWGDQDVYREASK